MRASLIGLAGAVALVVGGSSAFAASGTAANTVDAYAFAGGKDAKVMAPLETGRSAASDKAFTPSDLSHAFATWGY